VQPHAPVAGAAVRIGTNRGPAGRSAEKGDPSSHRPPATSGFFPVPGGPTPGNGGTRADWLARAGECCACARRARCVEWQPPRWPPVRAGLRGPTPDLRPVDLELMGHPPFLIRPADGAPPTPRPASPSGRCSTRRDWRCGVPCAPRASRRRSRRRRPRCSAARPDSGWPRRRRAGRHRAVAHRPRPGFRGGGGPPGPVAAATWAATLAQPELPAVLTASDGGIGVYRRMGYLPMVRWTMWFRS
jgi:hypothetical protein